MGTKEEAACGSHREDEEGKTRQRGWQQCDTKDRMGKEMEGERKKANEDADERKTRVASVRCSTRRDSRAFRVLSLLAS